MNVDKLLNELQILGTASCQWHRGVAKLLQAFQPRENALLLRISISSCSLTWLVARPVFLSKGLGHPLFDRKSFCVLLLECLVMLCLHLFSLFFLFFSCTGLRIPTVAVRSNRLLRLSAEWPVVIKRIATEGAVVGNQTLSMIVLVPADWLRFRPQTAPSSPQALLHTPSWQARSKCSREVVHLLSCDPFGCCLPGANPLTFVERSSSRRSSKRSRGLGHFPCRVPSRRCVAPLAFRPFRVCSCMLPKWCVGSSV